VVDIQEGIEEKRNNILMDVLGGFSADPGE